MKTWTVVVEVKDPSDSFTKSEIEELFDVLDGGSKFAGDLYKQVFECTEAPYGPQGVVLTEAKPSAIIHHGRLIDCPDVRSGKSTHCRGHIQNTIGRAGRVQTAPKEGRK